MEPLPKQLLSATATGITAGNSDGPFSGGVNTQKNGISGAEKVNDGIYTGPKGAYQRYTTSVAASDVARTP
jgi:hypothetical protein